jgi:hypothetical protein
MVLVITASALLAILARLSALTADVVIAYTPGVRIIYKHYIFYATWLGILIVDFDI